MGICVSCRRRERKAPEKRSVPGAGGPGKGAAAAELLPRRSDRLLTMANSMSNIKMSNPIKGIVSKRRRRFQKDGFNLDLAYITDRLIAMGFPAEKLEGVYRNHIDEVYRFLETRHKDRYMIYNLCSERSYDHSKFHDRVKKYAFEDHMPPDIEIIQPFCEDVHEWLSADPKNVAAVHCKAGKGRTGTMVCCYLLYSGQKATADDALKFYGTKRTHDEKGVTIPSQRRYVEYYAALLQSGLSYAPSKIHVRELIMCGGAALAASACSPELAITQAKPPVKTPAGCQEVVRAGSSVSVRLTHCTPLSGDVRVDVYNKHKMKMRKEKLFHFWFNTFFVTAELGACRVPPLHDSPNLETFKLTLNKWQLDDAHKDKQHKHYSQDFKVELIIQKMPESSTYVGVAARAPSPPSSSSSSGSEPDTEPDGHWDSGERVPYSLLAPHRHSGPAVYPSTGVVKCCRCKGSLGDDTSDLQSGPDIFPPTGVVYPPTNVVKCCHCKTSLEDDRRSPTGVGKCCRCDHHSGSDIYPPKGEVKCCHSKESLEDDRGSPTGEVKCCDCKGSLEDHSPFSNYAEGTYPPTSVVKCCHCKGSPEDDNSPFSEWKCEKCTCANRCCRSLSVSTPDDDSIPDYQNQKESKSEPLNFYRLSAPDSDPFYLTNSAESDSYLLPKDIKPDFFDETADATESYYKLTTESKKTEVSDGFYKMSTNGKKSEGARTRLSLGDVRASWREFSGKFTENRKKKDES